MNAITNYTELQFLTSIPMNNLFKSINSINKVKFCIKIPQIIDNNEITHLSKN
jgi:hypothetical protein